MTTPATLLEFGAIGDVPSILEIELPAILFNESLYIELNGSVTQLDGSGINQTSWNIGNNIITGTSSSSSSINNTNSSSGSTSSGNATNNITQLAEEEQRAANERAAAEFLLLVKMIAMAVVLGLMILVTIIGKNLAKKFIKNTFKSHSLPFKAAAGNLGGGFEKFWQCEAWYLWAGCGRAARFRR